MIFQKRTYYSPLLKRLLLFLFLTVTSVTESKAQQQLISTMPDMLHSIYNPAKAGDSEWLRFAGSAVMLQKGDPRHPYSISGNADLPLTHPGINAGAGLVVMRQSFGPLSYNLADVQLSYRFKINSGSVSIGLTAGVVDMKLKMPFNNDKDGDKIAEDLANESSNKRRIDLGIGTSFRKEDFHASASLLHITSPSVSLSYLPESSSDSIRLTEKIRPALYFETGGNIATRNPLFILQTSMLAALSSAHSSLDIQFGGRYRRSYYLGLGYRWNQYLFLRAEVCLKNFFLGYSFGYPASNAAKDFSLRHEIAAGYRIKVDFSGVKKFKQRSIRIM